MKITKEATEQIISLLHAKSVAEICSIVGCSRSSVYKVMGDQNIARSKEDISQMRSRVRTDLIRAEKRRCIYGLDQKTGVKVFFNKERNTLKGCLRRKGYYFPERGKNVAYYDDTTVRNAIYEERGRKLGITFVSAKAITI